MAERTVELAEVFRTFEARFRELGFPLTVQRRIILEEMLLREDHPTAEQIYDAARARVPEISRGTVYRTLETLVQLGAIGRAHYLGPATRFDSNTNHHHHLVCIRCNRVMDFEDARLNDLPFPERTRTGFQIVDYSIHFIGLCAECQQAEPSATP
jgi:Fur family transcriptional regulator, peroxide stress response regulator